MGAVPSLTEVQVEAGGHIVTVTLNRPEQRNVLSTAMLRDLLEALTWCRKEPEVRVVILTGAGERAFCAGADLASFHADQPELDRRHDQQAFVALFELLQDIGKPVVGRINGHALAGGFGLACACDLLVAAETATFGTPEINLALWPMIIQAILARNLPRKVLLEMILLGGRWSAAQLHAYGLVNRVVPADQLDVVTTQIARELARKSPAVMRLGRDAFYRAQDMEFRAALRHLQGQLALVALTDDSREGIRAFLEKREPRFQDR